MRDAEGYASPGHDASVAQVDSPNRAVKYLFAAESAGEKRMRDAEGYASSGFDASVAQVDSPSEPSAQLKELR